jgi:GTP cyclohydrolase I
VAPIKPNTGFTVGKEKLQQGVSLILEGLHDVYGLDNTDDNFRDTPARVMRAYLEIFDGLANTDEQVKAILATSFPSRNNSMVIQRDIRVYSMCPHHMLPVELRVHLAYIPNPDKGGRVLGLSKLARIAELLAFRPCLQEEYAADVTAALSSLPGCMGSACVAYGRHFCMIMRGVKQRDAVTVTSSVRGVFADEPGVREEFLSLARGV